MRWLISAMAGTALLGLAPAAPAQVTAEKLLEFRPFLKGVEYDIPADKEAASACKVEIDKTPKGGGFILRDGQGRILRRFCANNPQVSKGKLDQWGYYQNGFEVYREVDLDGDNHVDEVRWMNSGGTRTAVVRSGKVVAWKRLSPEEASKVFVGALLAGDADLIETLMATPEELAALGLPKVYLDRVARDASGRAEALGALRQGLVGWSEQAAWQRFDGMMPHVIPADSGLKADLVLYENAFIFGWRPDGKGDPMKMAYLQVPELVKVGETWKFTELPKAVNPSSPVVAAIEGGLRASLMAGTAGGPSEPADPEHQKALEALAQYDQQKAPPPDATKKQLAEYHHGRIPLLNAVIRTATKAEDRQNFNRQAIDSLAAAYQTGLYSAGKAVLENFVKAGGALGSYARYRTIFSEYALEADQPGNDPIGVQKSFLARLDEFLKDFPDSDEAPDVLLQIASLNEFSAEEKEARASYARLAADYPETEAGKKAAGALRRLDLVGTSLKLQGAGPEGKTLSTDSYRGKTLLVAFWSSAPDNVRRDLPELVKVYRKYQPQGFEVLGVNLDDDPEALKAFLAANPLPWPQIVEPGGMDSRLADEFGIMSVPTMILVDPQGKVLHRNIRSAAELDRVLEQSLAGGNATASIGGDSPR